MSFNVAQALAICTANLASRKKSGGGSNTYILYYSNGTDRYDGKVIGNKILGDGGLIDTFKKNHNKYTYAYIVNKLDEDKTLWFFNRAVSNKFFSMTRTGIKRTKKNSHD
jgi:hypothetical protein